jgi:predicted ATPase
MIRKLRLKNFLSYKDISIEFNDFNVILGPNASGKTNLVKALIVLRDLINGGHQSLEDFDGFMEGVFNKTSNENESLMIEVVIDNKMTIELKNGTEIKKIKTEEHHYKVELAFGKGIVYESYWIKLMDHKKPFKVLERNESEAKYTHEYDETFSKTLAISVDSKLFNIIKYQTIAGKAFSGFLPIIRQAYCDFFLTYALSSGHLIMPYFSRNQKILATNGQNLSGVLQYYKDHNPIVVDSINDILKRNIPNFEYVETKPLGVSKNFYFNVREKDGKDYILNELSEGTDLFIGLITAMVTSQFLEIPEKFKGIMIIEEPEKNLHPQLMEEIVTVAKSLTDKFQVIITTHSTDLVSHLEVEDLILLDKKKDGTRLKRIQRGKELDLYLEEFSLDQIWINNDLGGGTLND